MDERHQLRDTLIEAAVAASGTTAFSACTFAVFAILTGEFVSTRAYLVEMGLAFGLLTCVLFLGVRLLRNGRRGG